MLVNDSDSEVEAKVTSNRKETDQTDMSKINNLWSAPTPYRRVSLLRIAQFYQSKLAINQIEDGSF
jgi:hypothetical protein